MITKAFPALLIDLLLVLLFAAIGRSSHSEGMSAGGVLLTALPFLAGALFGWVMQWIFEKRAAITVADGATVWVATVAAGMTIRYLTDQGIAFSFIVVATIVLGVFLVGWRFLNAVARKRPAHR